MKKNKLIFLGCGSSQGVPGVHPTKPQGEWGNCDPAEPRNRRTRSSIYLEYQGVRLLIDTSPDLYHQYHREQLTGIDAILYTHTHADHTHGIAEMRTLFFNGTHRKIPVYSAYSILEDLKKTFPYLFFGRPGLSTAPQILETFPVKGTFDIQSQPIITFPQVHGKGLSMGYRFGNIAYSTDFNDLEAEAVSMLENLDIWIVGCTWRNGAPSSHLSLEQVFTWQQRLKPKQIYLTHMGKTMDYRSLCQDLPSTIQPAYDGLTLYFDTPQ